MNRFLQTSVLFLLVAVSTASATGFEFGGIFPAKRTGSELISNYVLIQSPGNLLFELTDPAGKPTKDVAVVRVTLTSAPDETFFDKNGISLLKLHSAGIYEVKVSPQTQDPRELAFTLKVINASEQAVSTEVKTSPTQHAVAMGSDDPVPPQRDPEPTDLQPAPLTIQSPVPTPPVIEETRSLIASESFTARLIHAGEGFADPFRPIEVEFFPGLGKPVDPSALVHLFRLNQKGEMDRIYGHYSVSENTVRFMPAELANGGVYHGKILSPANNENIGSFKLVTFPEVDLRISRADGAVNVTLRWKALADLLPTIEGQVVSLGWSEIVVGEVENPIVFRLDESLPPIGTRNGLSFRARPFNFSLRISEAELQSRGINPSDLSTRLLAWFAGREKPLEVGSTRLRTRAETVSPPIPNDLENMLAFEAEPYKIETQQAVPEHKQTRVAQVSEPATVFQPAASPMMPPAPPAPATVAVDVAQPSIHQVEPKMLPVYEKPVPIENPGMDAKLVFQASFPAFKESEDSLISWPRGLAWDDEGLLWVADSQNRRILRFGSDGRLVTFFGERGRNPGQMGLPVELAVSAQYVFVSDTAEHCIHVFDKNGGFVTRFGVWGTKTGQMDLPHGLLFDGEQVWVADRGNSCILRFATDGTYRGGFGEKGDSIGYLNNPVSIRLFGDRAWTIESNGRIQCFSKTGAFVKSFSSGFQYPTSMVVDHWGGIWVVDSTAKVVARFDGDGRKLVEVTRPVPGRNWIPTSVSVRVDGLVAVSDVQNREIYLFRLTGH